MLAVVEDSLTVSSHMARDASCWPYQPLHDACVARDWGLVVRLATSPRGPDLARAHDRNGWLPLHIAVERSAPIATIHALLDAYADAVRTRTEHGDLPLHVAAIYGAPVAVVHLLCWKHPVRECEPTSLIATARAVDR